MISQVGNVEVQIDRTRWMVQGANADGRASPWLTRSDGERERFVG